MLSDILSGICSDILSSILSGIYFYILSDIYFDIFSKILSGILSAIYVLTLYLAFVLAFYLTYIWPIYNNSHLAISSSIRFGELLGSYLCLTDHVGALLFLAKEYVKKQLFISWKVDSPLDRIEALHLRPNSQKHFSASESVSCSSSCPLKKPHLMGA